MCLFMMPQAALRPSVRNLIKKYTERKTNHRVKGPLDHSSYLLIAGYLSRALTLSLLCDLTIVRPNKRCVHCSMFKHAIAADLKSI